MSLFGPISGLSRRLFLGGAGGGLILGSALGGARSAAAQEGGSGAVSGPPPERPVGRPEPKGDLPEEPGRRVGFAVVGLGKFALQQIIPSFAQSKSTRLVALVSGNRAKAEKIAARYGVDPRGIYDYESFDRIADNPAVDVIYIILPNGLHAEFTTRAFAAGKHVMCEKPMARNVEECAAMIRAGREAGRRLMIGYRAHYEPHNVEAIRRIRAGEIGAVRLVTSDHGRHLDPKDPADQWRSVKALAGGGSLYDIGIYALNAARYLTGEEPVEVSGQISSPQDDPRFREVEDLVTFQLRFPSGALANLSSSYSYQSVKRIQAFGTEASLILDPATEYQGNELVLETQRGRERVQVEETSQFAAEMDHFAGSIRANRDPRTPGEEGLRDVAIMQAVYRSAAEGRPIPLEVTGSTGR